MKKIIIVFLLLVLTGCADSVNVYTSHVQVGFFHGLWHGIIILFSWIGSLFSDDIAIYAVYNNGGWYDFGFALGVGALAGGSNRAS